ncbi:hypothetical protein NC651_037450 [Populus alba x Populus x berolinensis]|nr:hypothetical protein NC651_037450 [Populus alba x Populus x berolinensis]
MIHSTIAMSFFIRFPEEKVEELLHNHLHPLSAGSSSFTSLNRQSILCNLEGRVGVADAVWVLTFARFQSQIRVCFPLRDLHCM